MAARKRAATVRTLAATVATDAFNVGLLADEIQKRFEGSRIRRALGVASPAVRRREHHEDLATIAAGLAVYKMRLRQILTEILVPPHGLSAEGEAWLRRQLEGLEDGGA